ncbi:MAG: VOC family protein [Sporocytophaga sp.]|nr:VOC family protein [Sporocytophaga sp.]
MKLNQIKETCLYVKDLEKSKAFYNGLLGLPIIGYHKDRHLFLRAGNSVLLCFLPEITKHDKELPPHYAYGKIHVAFEVPEEDYELWKMMMYEKGINITYEKEWNQNIKSFYFEDPDGNVLEIIPPGLWH